VFYFMLHSDSESNSESIIFWLLLNT